MQSDVEQIIGADQDIDTGGIAGIIRIDACVEKMINRKLNHELIDKLLKSRSNDVGNDRLFDILGHASGSSTESKVDSVNPV